METKHTPGWRISPIYSEYGMCANDGSIPIIAGDDEQAGPIASVLPTVEFKRGQGHKLKDDPKRDEHARLIAAAPDLLEAAKSALEALCIHDAQDGYAGDLLRAAIAKAEGK